MTRKFTFLILALFALIAGPGWGQTTTTTTYTFNSKSWGAKIGETAANWTSKKDGNQFTANQGIQITNGTSGACGNSDVAFDNVSKITVTYCTNAKAGKGTISWYNVESTSAAAQSGNLVGSQSITAPSSGGTTLKTFDIIPESSQTGYIQLYVECSTNSIYVWSVEIQYTTGPSTDPTITVNPTSIDLGTVSTNEEAEATFTVSQANLTSNISLSAGNGNLDTESIAADASTPTEITYTITPSAAGEFSDVITISCDDLEEDITINVSGNAIDPSQFVTYEKVTSADDLIAGKHYIIVGKKNETYYAMGGQKSNNRDAVEINVTETTATVTPTDAVHEFFLSGDRTNHYTFYDKADGSKGFLYAANSSSNYLRTEETLDDNGKWTIEIDEETGEAIIKAQGDYSRNMMRFNSSNELFSCYSGGQQPVYLYKNDNPFPPEIFSNTTVENLDITKGLIVNDYVRLEVTGGFIVDVNAPAPTEEEIQDIVEVGVTATPSVPLCLGHASQLVHNVGSPTGTIVKDIEHKYNSGSGRADWNTIACPLGINMLGGLWIGSSQEIYSYDETIHFWIKNNEPIVQAGLGKGFIYGVPEEATCIRVSMIGTLPPSNVDKSFPLSYTEGLDALNGFNLVGNPFTCNAYVNRDYMVLNEEGSGFVNGGVIRPCDAILVQATGANQQITFSRDEFPQQNNRIDVSISQNRGNVIDNARIRFGEGRGMNKFYLNENSTRLYIPQNGKDYAVVMASAAEGEMPVNFKAEKNGTYTITVNTENVEANYLHLIDNLTGMDTDLLSTPSYTFNAKTSDYASRFKLVFGVKNDNEEMSQASSFAYINNGEIVISNEGRATLQVIDVMGRIISSEEINGEARISTNGMTAGMYVLNLNGNVQKIVVR